MIPAQNIVAWGNLVPWTDARQIEQDLIISRALVEIFSDSTLREALRFRGGTAREVEAFDGPTALPLDVANPWFSGRAAISTFSREEMLATKLRALLQRNKGRDLYDLAHGLEVLEDLDSDRISSTGCPVNPGVGRRR